MSIACIMWFLLTILRHKDYICDCQAVASAIESGDNHSVPNSPSTITISVGLLL
jgi:hypothetical protein